jgi:hypothetical protein
MIDYTLNALQEVGIRELKSYDDTIEVTITESVTKLAPHSTLRVLANVVYGDASKWYLIADANAPLDPSTIKAGDQIKIPRNPDNTVVIVGRKL